MASWTTTETRPSAAQAQVGASAPMSHVHAAAMASPRPQSVGQGSQSGPTKPPAHVSQVT